MIGANVGGDEEYRTPYDGDVESLSAAVVRAIAEATDTAPTELKSLDHVVDTDALDALFVPTVTGRPRGDGSITFEFDGHGITVHSYGIIAGRPGRAADR